MKKTISLKLHTPKPPTLTEQLGKMLRHCQDSPGYPVTAANLVFLLHQLIALAERLERLEAKA